VEEFEMSEEEIRKVFSNNLNYFLQLNNKQPVDMVNDLKIPFSTVSNWCNGLKMPRMGKVELMANYFHIEKSDLLEDKKEKKEKGYYINDETKMMLEELRVNPKLKILFDASKKLEPSDIDFVLNMVERLKKEESGNMKY
jgi:transcriptional regulator with XRE-family HTH domain